jgi:hypothetical protein
VGALTCVTVLKPDGNKGKRRFPPELVHVPPADLRIGDAENAWEWLERIRPALDGKDVDRCQIDVGCGMVGEVAWDNGVVSSITCQCIVRPGAPLSISSARRAEVQYLRLDFDVANLGPLLSEPLPHIHVRGNSAPRMEFRGLTPKRLLSSFLDFIYRNYYFESWEAWARAVWEDGRHAGGYGPHTFDEVCQAFVRNDHQLLTGPRRELMRHMKKAWRKEIARIDSLVVEVGRCATLSP